MSDKQLPQNRRKLLLAMFSSAASLAVITPRLALSADFTAPANHSGFTEQAFNMRKKAIDQGDQSYGAIVVKNAEIVGYGPSRVITNRDPTAHAEMEAIRDAARNLGSRDLSHCILYSSSHPCRMCETAAYWAGISRMYFGSAGKDGGKPGYGC